MIEALWPISSVPKGTSLAAQTIDESLATSRLAERKKVRQERREASKRLSALRPEERAEAMSEEERIERRIAVLEQVLGVDAAKRFRDNMTVTQYMPNAAEARQEVLKVSEKRRI